MPIPSSPPSASSAFAEVEFDLLREDFLAKFERVHVRLNALEVKLEKLIEEKHEVVVSSLDPEENPDTNIKPGPGHENFQESPWIQDDLKDVKMDVKEESVEDQQQGEVHFAESAWTYPVVIGLAKAGPLEVAFAVLLLLVNLCVQAGFSGILLVPPFTGNDFSAQIGFAKQWRNGVAHDQKYADLADTSLVTRVCKGDGALILSNRQATLIEHINSYLGLENDDFVPGFFQPGAFLCVLCILLWCLCIYKELRSIFLSFEAVSQIPRTSRTILVDQQDFAGLSFGRYKVLKLIYGLRTAIACLLLVSGVSWLSQTTSITELMLNAVALNAILDVDEFLFAGFTPMGIHTAIQKLGSIQVKYSTRRNKVESLMLFLLLLSTLLVPYLAFLKPLTDTMISVKQELCGGNQTFVISQNPQTQVILGYVSQDGRGNESVTERAVSDHVFGSGLDPKYIFFTSPVSFATETKRSMAEESVDFTFCVETEYMTPGGSWYQDPAVGGMVEVRFRTATAMLGRFDVTGCQEVADLCYHHDARLLRMMCGATCNCTNPYSNAWYKVPNLGCSQSCLDLAINTLAKPGRCVDQPNDEIWKEIWDGYIPMLTLQYGSQVANSGAITMVQNMVEAMKMNGCSQLQVESMKTMVGDTNLWCEGDSELLRPLAWTCPESCGCTSPEAAANPPAYCPRSCFA